MLAGVELKVTWVCEILIRGQIERDAPSNIRTSPKLTTPETPSNAPGRSNEGACQVCNRMVSLGEMRWVVLLVTQFAFVVPVGYEVAFVTIGWVILSGESPA
ncbi:hypothetical protein BQ8794_280053 [Mesorhizobium prunaredense]|uniref:Uncharacterized protein n=1 Tax=Mesorhizobium prunaredense TaxID=1631249 RepID=A0A1R3V933_9HYPH|nr:hypothetical protein BQ8794_280053 [Mesorhizobium prunaredense]